MAETPRIVMAVDRPSDIPRACEGCAWTYWGDGGRWRLTRIDPACPAHGHAAPSPASDSPEVPPMTPTPERGHLADVVRANFPPLPPRRPGRPEVGPSTNLRLPPELRARLDAARRPREGVAAAARRLLAVALADVLPDALALAAAKWDALRALCPCRDDDVPCEAHAEAVNLAADCRALLAELTAPPSPASERVSVPCGHCDGTGYCTLAHCARCASWREQTETSECGACRGTAVRIVPKD